MTRIMVPPTCHICTPSGDAFPYPQKDGRVLTRIRWAGTNPRGVHMIDWEGTAGQVPSQLEFPSVNFRPVECWCPVCNLQYHIGRPHPVDEKALDDAQAAQGPKLVVP